MVNNLSFVSLFLILHIFPVFTQFVFWCFTGQLYRPTYPPPPPTSQSCVIFLCLSQFSFVTFSFLTFTFYSNCLSNILFIFSFWLSGTLFIASAHSFSFHIISLLIDFSTLIKSVCYLPVSSIHLFHIPPSIHFVFLLINISQSSAFPLPLSCIHTFLLLFSPDFFKTYSFCNVPQ